MDLQSFLLFVSFIVFGVFNLYTNIQAADKWLKFSTLYLIYLSIIGSLIMLVISLYRVVAG